MPSAPPLQPADEDVAAAEEDEVDGDRAAVPGHARARPSAPVIEAAAIEVPVAEVHKPAPRAIPDPLAPIMALSAEEKIALFT